jgi:hypothetical protein
MRTVRPEDVKPREATKPAPKLATLQDQILAAEAAKRKDPK